MYALKGGVGDTASITTPRFGLNLLEIVERISQPISPRLESVKS